MTAVFHREVYKYAYSPDGSLNGYVNNSLSYFNVKDFSAMSLPRDPFLNLPYNKSYCRSVNKSVSQRNMSYFKKIVEILYFPGLCQWNKYSR